MSVAIANEGTKVLFDICHKGGNVDRGTDLQMGLLTNVGTIDDLKALALTDITEPTGGGYARKTLSDASWDNSVSRVSSYAKQTFTATGGAMTGTIYGWFICTTGTTDRLLYVGRLDDAPGGLTLPEGSSISQTPRVIS